ncbi:MAG: hypothetical protein IT376_01870 [Polyangiaceae bacterium]|nr:hypothetical protein [Polyangiaceae bacterium]
MLGLPAAAPCGWLALAALAALAAGCTSGAEAAERAAEPARPRAANAAPVASGSARIATSARARATTPGAARAPASASAPRGPAAPGPPVAGASSAGPAPSLAAPSPILDPGCPENRCLAPDAADDLARKAALLVEALTARDPSPAEPCFFPLEPFLVLKAARAPGRYHGLLLDTFRRDVSALAEAATDGGRDAPGARVLRVHAVAPEWIPPGREQNRVGYYRARRVLVRWAAGGRERELLVATAITWNGRWFVTHLR